MIRIKGLSPYIKSFVRGKVILKLDINSGWADKLSLAIPQLREMYENCDLIT